MKPGTINTRTLFRVGLIANILESYEWAIYNFLALIIGKLFLQATDKNTLYIQSYLLFTISFLARPLGSILWGYFADRIGRSHILKVTLIVGSVSTALIGMLPTYHEIGIWALISFLILRFLQGFSMGGEYSISGCYVYEAAPPRYRSLLCGIVSASNVIGMLGGSCVAALLFLTFDEATILRWAWRLPYLLGIPISFWIGYIRKSVKEPYDSPVNSQAAQDRYFTQSERLDFIKNLIAVVLIGGFMQVCSYALFIWLPSYLSHFLAIDSSIAQVCNVAGLIIWVPLIILSGYLGGKWGYKRILIIHTLAMIILIVPLFKLLQLGTYSALLAAYVMFAWLQSGAPGVMMEVLGDAFPPKTRGLGMSLAQNLSASLFGGTLPWLSSIIITNTGILIFPALYIIIMGLVILPVIPRLQEKNLREDLVV
jgi:MHS family proline/betaine transporter-like MFS transporter